MMRRPLLILAGLLAGASMSLPPATWLGRLDRASLGSTPAFAQNESNSEDQAGDQANQAQQRDEDQEEQSRYQEQQQEEQQQEEQQQEEQRHQEETDRINSERQDNGD